MLTLSQVADRLQVSRSTVIREIGDGRLAVTSKYAHLGGDDLAKAVNSAMGKVRLK